VFQRLQRQEIVNEDLLTQLKAVESRNGFLMVENQEIKSKVQATRSQTPVKEDALSSMQSEIAALRDQFEAKVESVSTERITKIQIQMDEAAEENEELKARAQSLESREKEVQAMVAEKESEKESLVEELEGTRMELEMSKTMVQEMESRVLQLETSKANLTKHLQSTQIVASESNETLSKFILEKDEEIASCRSELHAAIAARDSFEDKLAQVTDEGGVLKAAAEASTNRVKELESTSAQFENEKNNLQESLDAVEETHQETCQQKEAVERELSEIKDAHQSLQNSLEEQDHNFKAYKEECDSVVQTLMGDMQEKEEIVFETKEFVSKLESTKESLEERIDELSSQIAHLEAENADTEEELERTRAELSRNKNEASEMEDKILEQLEGGEAHARSAIDAKDKEIASLTGEVAQATAKILDLESELAQADDDVESLEANLQEMEALKSNLDEEKRSIVEQKEKVQTTTRAEITALASKLEIVSKELVKSIETREDVEVESSSQIAYFKAQIDATGKQLTTARLEASSLEEEVKALRSSNSSLEQEIQHLSDSDAETLGEAQAKLAELHFQLDSKSSDLMASTERLNKLQEEHDSARAMYDHTKSVLESQLDQAGDRISLLEANVRSLETAKSLLEEELESQKQAAETSSTQATVTIRKLESQLEKSADELSSSHGVLGSLQEREANAVAGLEQWRTSYSDIEGRLTKAQERCTNVETQLEETSEKLQTAQASNGETEGSLQRELGAKSDELSVSVRALKTLETEMSTIASARDDLAAKLATTESLLSTTMSNAISLEDKISSLEDEIRVQDQKSMDSLSEAKATVESLNFQLTAIEEEKTSLSLERELLKTSCTELESKLKEGATKIETLEEAIANLKSCQEEELKRMAESSEVDSALLKKEISVLGDELQMKSAALCTAENGLEALTVDKLSISGERDTLESKLTEAESQFTGAVNEMRFLKTQLMDSQVELAESRGLLDILEKTKLEGDSGLRVWEAKCAKAEKNLTEASQRVSVFEKDVESLESNKHALSDEIHTLKKANSGIAIEFQERLLTLQNELELKNEDLSSKLKELVLLESYRESIASDREGLTEKTAELEIQLVDAREEIQKKETVNATIESSRVVLETRIQTQKKESEDALARAQEELGALESDLEVSHLKVTASEEAVDSLEAAKAAVLSELDSIKTRLETSVRNLDQANEQIQSLQDEIDVHESDKENLKKETQSVAESNSSNSTGLISKISSLEAAVGEKLNEISSAKEREDAMNEAKLSLEEEIKSLIIEKEGAEGTEKSIAAQRYQLEIEVAESRMELGEAQEVIDALRSGKQSLEDKMKLASDQHDEAIAYISLQKTLLESELKTKTEESLYASNSTEVVEQRLKEKAAELDLSQRKVEEAGTQLVTVRKTVCVLNDSLSELTSSKTSLETKNNLLEKEMDERNRKIVELEVLAKELSGEVAKRSRSEKELEEASHEKDVKLSDAKLEVSILEKKVSSLGIGQAKMQEEYESSSARTNESRLCARAEVEVLHSQLKERDGSRQDVLARIQWTEQERESLVMRTAELQHALSGARKQASQRHETVCAFEDSQSDLEEEIQLLRTTLDEKEGIVAANAMQLMKRSSEVQNLRVDLEARSEQLETSEHALQDLREKLSELELATEAEKLSFVAERGSAQDELARLTIERDQSIEEIVSLTEKVKVTEEQLARSETQVMHHRNDESGLKSSVDEIRDLVRDKEDENRRLQDERNAVQNSLRVASTRVAELDELLQESEEEMKKMKGEVEETKREHFEVAKDITRSHVAEVEELNSQKRETEKKIYAAEINGEELAKRLEVAESELLAEQRRGEKSAKEKNDLAKALYEAEDAVSELRCELVLIQEDMDESSDDDSTDSELKQFTKAELREECLYLQNELVEAESRVSESETEAKKYSTRAEGLESDYASVSNELELLLQTNQNLDKMLTDLQAAKAGAQAAAEASVKAALSFERKLSKLEEDLQRESRDNAEKAEQLEHLKQEIFSCSSKFEEQITDLMAAKAASEDAAQISSNTALALEQKLFLVEQELEKKAQEKSANAEEAEGLRNELDILTARLEEREASSNNNTSKLEKTFLRLLSECVAMRIRVKCQKKDIVTLRTRDDESRIQISSLEAQRHELESEKSKENQRLNDAASEIKLLAPLAKQLSDDLLATKDALIETARQREGLESDIQKKEELLEEMVQKLESQRGRAAKMEYMREEAVSKLSDASNALAAQKSEIRELECRLVEAERFSQAHSDEVLQLSESKDRLENNLSKEVKDLRQVIQQLQEERDSSRVGIENRDEDLRQANRKFAQVERINESLQERIEELKNTVIELKEKRKSAEARYDESEASCKNLEKELDNRRVQIDHFKAKIQILEATMSRMKSALTLAQEPAHKIDGDEKRSEEVPAVNVAHLRSEMKLMSSHIASISSALQRQKQVNSELELSEGVLVNFIQEVIGLASTAQKEILSKTELLQKLESRLAPSRQIVALDLAGLERTEPCSVEVRSCLEKLAYFVAKALEELHGRRVEFEQWQNRRSQPPPNPITPTFETAQTFTFSPSPSRESCRDALTKMKTVLHDEIITPYKKGNIDLDPTRLRQVVESLEIKMDSLLEDMALANDALGGSDTVATEMSELVAKHESERAMLEKKVSSFDAELRSLMEQLKDETSLRIEAEAGLATLRESAGTNSEVSTRSVRGEVTSSDRVAKVVAGRLMCGVLEKRSKIEMAGVFRKWSCSTSVHRAATNEKHAAAMAEQLEITREKLVLLKGNLKNGKRHQSSGDEQRKPRLRRLLGRALDKRDKKDIPEGGRDTRNL
jgi:chromosome segregation ATPase